MRGIGPADYPRATNDVTLQPEFIRLHVLTKNLQSVRDQSRWEDLLVEFEVCDCDVGFFTETWRSKRQECFEMSSGGRLFLSGGGSRQGVGIGISARIVIGGDFNANVGSLQWSDEQDVVGEWGSGLRNARGATLISWILMNGLRIASRQSPTNNVDDSWTCQRTMDGARVQLDYILTDARACVDTIWHDQLIPIGLDHRCVHCLLRWRGVRPSLGNNGQWSMVNACTPQGEPILGTGGGKKYVHWFRMQVQISFTSGKSLQKVHSSDDGISLPLAMVPNLCIWRHGVKSQSQSLLARRQPL